jgi:RNA polymerase sigma-70 factor (sigma-E family)
VTFEEFAASRLPGVLAFAAMLTGQRATAEDIAQEVLTRACARWDMIGGLDRPEFYVRKMVLNEFLSWRRRSGRLILAGDAVATAPSISDLADQYADRNALLAEISKLPRRQRAVLVLRYYEDRSDAQIAELLGCRPATVRAYASRALAALRIEARQRFRTCRTSRHPTASPHPRLPPLSGHRTGARRRTSRTAR